MPQPVIKQPDSPLLTKEQLAQWLNLSPWKVRKFLSDAEFMNRCTVNVALPHARRRDLRFRVSAVADYMQLPADLPRPAAVEAAA